jgi:hypothetical protein
MGKPIVHFEVNSRNAKRAQSFYQSLFGWKIDTNNPMNYGLVNTGTKKGIQGGIGQVEANRSPYTTFYIEVDNPQRYLDQATQLGGSVVTPVTKVPNMITFAQFADPDGNVIGLVKSASAPTSRPKKSTSKKHSSKSSRK